MRWFSWDKIYFYLFDHNNQEIIQLACLMLGPALSGLQVPFPDLWQVIQKTRSLRYNSYHHYNHNHQRLPPITVMTHQPHHLIFRPPCSCCPTHTPPETKTSKAPLLQYNWHQYTQKIHQYHFKPLVEMGGFPPPPVTENRQKFSLKSGWKRAKICVFWPKKALF